jgi:hypothetical protein
MEQNSRISDVLHTLADPVEYVRGTVGSFVEYQFDGARSIVRIGTSGRGIVPNYSIETRTNTILMSSLNGMCSMAEATRKYWTTLLLAKIGVRME